MSFISSAPHRKYVKVVSTVIHAENLNPGMRNTPSCSAAKPSAEPREPPARIRKEIDSDSGSVRPNTFLGSPGAAFATPPALLRNKHTRGKGEFRVEAAFFYPASRLFAHVSSSHRARLDTWPEETCFLPCPKPCAIGRPRAARDARRRSGRASSPRAKK